MITDIYKNFSIARRAGTPLMAVNCIDPEAFVQGIQERQKDTIPVVQWDIIRGWRQRNKAGEDAIIEAFKKAGVGPDDVLNPVGCLEIAVHLPEDTILFMLNAQFHLKPEKATATFVQALWNLRDLFKDDGRTVVMVGHHYELPPEVQQDVLQLDEPLPTDEWLRDMISSMAKKNDLTVTDESLTAAVDALRGLAAFPSEQATAMSFTKEGLNIETLWDRKRQLINNTPGLSVWKGGQTFKDLGGLDAVKRRFERILKGRKAPRVVVWIDEIEKAMGGSDPGSGDSSGTSQDQLGVLLSEMQDKEYSGAIFVGVPGAAKSAFAKAIANEAGVLTIKLDLGELKGKFVGVSEERIRHAMKVIDAVGGEGGAMFIATSNDIRCLKPELKRRFKKGIWFFDTPNEDERLAIWSLYLNKFNLPTPSRFSFDDGWTGAEIEACAQTAWEENISLEEAARTIIPVTVSGAAEVERLRSEANGRYIATNHDGPYTVTQSQTKTSAVKNARKLQL